MAPGLALRVAVPVLLLAWLGLAGIGAAAEARLGLTFDPLPPVEPGGEARLAGNLTYSYDAASPNATRVSLLLDPPTGWLRASLSPAVLALPANASGNRSVAPVTLVLTVAPGAPALAGQAVVVHAMAEPNPPLDGALAAGSAQVQVAYAGKLRVEAQPPGPQRPGDPFVVALNVTNLGNGPTRVVLEANASSPRAQVVAPSPFIVDRDETRTVNVSVLADAAGPVGITIRYGSAYAFDPSLVGPSDVLTLPVEVTQSQLVPGFGPVLGLAALALVAAAARRG